MWKVDYQIRRHSTTINGIDLSSDMKHIFTASSDCTVGIFDRENQDIDLLPAHSEPIYDVKISPDESMFATCSLDKTAKIWDFNNHDLIFTCKTHKMAVSRVAWEQNSKQLLTASHDGSCILWDVSNFERICIMSVMQNWINDIQVYDDLIAVVGNDRFIYIYDKRTGKVAQKIPTQTEVDLTSVSFHHLGSCLAVGAKDSKVRIWDLRTADIIRRQRAHAESVSRVAFRPNSDDYITVSCDGFARIWSLKTTDIVASFKQHEMGITNVTWARDGKHFATVGDDRKICVFYENEENNDGFDGGDMLAALAKMQEQMCMLSSTMKRLDERLILQEDKIKFLQGIDAPISRANKRSKK